MPLACREAPQTPLSGARLAVHQPQLHALAGQGERQVVEGLDADRFDLGPRHPHAGVVQVFEGGDRQFVAKEARRAEAFEPGPFDMGDHAAGPPSPPNREVLGRRRRRRIEQDAGTVAREEIERLARLIDGPDQRLVQPVAPGRPHGRHAHWARRETRQAAVVAEVEEAHGNRRR
jgi:hypothetical protein